MRLLRSPALWVILAASILAIFTNVVVDNRISANPNSENDRPPLSQMAKEESALREGTQLNEVKGRFRKQGDRFQFTEDGGQKSFKCLENLCLQRISVNQQDEDRKITWLISAKVTEFNGENYLILEKAVRSR